MAETRRRRSYETGHQPKFMVVVDGSAESDRAIHFAARRTARLGARLLMLAVVEPPDDFEWIGVGDTLEAEARVEAEARLDACAAAARAAAGVDPEQVVRVGIPSEEIVGLIEEDEDVSFLVLAAGTGRDGANPLVGGLTGRAAAAFPIPIVIVPGGLSDAEIEALAG